MRHMYGIARSLAGLAALAFTMSGCSSHLPTQPAPNGGGDVSGVVRGTVDPAAIQFEFISATNNDPLNPLDGPFAIRGRNIRYEGGALVIDLSVANLGKNTYPKPVSLTFLSLLPAGVTVGNPDNGESGAGASIDFTFENPDGLWMPGEETHGRSTNLVVANGTSIAFVAQINAGSGDDGLGAIGGVVWNDADGNGVMDPGESVIVNAAVALDAEGMKTVTTTTEADGSYRFEGLQAGFYTVTKVATEGQEVTSGNPLFVTLVKHEGVVSSFLAANFGYQSKGGGAALITGVVFDDTDGDGVRDEGEPGIGAAVIDLTGPNGLHGTGTTVGGGSGAYTFLAGSAGEYTVTSSPITGKTATTPTAVTFTLAEGESRANVNFGYQSKGGGAALITGVVFDDTDGDGVRDKGEPGIGAAVIDLTGPNGLHGTGTTVGGGSGAYTFLAGSAGEYTVTSRPITGKTATTPTAVTFTLAEGESRANVNFGYQSKGGGAALITGVVFDDTDGDGVRDDGEPGIGAAVIDLTGPNGLHGTGTTVGGGSGAYTFLAGSAGEYTVTSRPITGKTATTPTAVTFTLAEGESRANVNFGYQSKGGGAALITGVVFDDTDGDGVRDDGEPGIGAAVIDLTGPNGLHGTGTTVGGGSGAYTFLAGSAGEYTVTSRPITGKTATTPTAVTFTLAEGESRANVNFGYQSKGGGAALITGVVFDDTDGDGVRDDGEPGIGAAVIDLTGPNGLHGTGTTVGGGSGAYTFLAGSAGEYTVTSRPITGKTATTPTAVTFTLAEGESRANVNFGYQSEGGGTAIITGVVFDDTDGDGVRDDGEPGIGAAVIDLTGPNGLHGTGTTVGGGSGAYTFLAGSAGEYTVTSRPITGKTATTPTAVTFTLAEGESRANVNFGYQSKGGGAALITGVVFDDTDGDGVRDKGEPGIGAAVIDLTGPNGLHGTGTTVGGGSGAYTFLAGSAGEYTVTSRPITGKTATTPTAVTFTLAEGESRANVNFGYKTKGGGAAALFGIVFDDHNGNGEIDEGDDGIPGVRVRLCPKETGNSKHDKHCPFCRFSLTHHDGSYSFDDLDAGRYKLEAKRPRGFYAVTDSKLEIEILDGQNANVDFAFARKCKIDHDHSNDRDDDDDSVALSGGGNRSTSAGK